MRMKKIDVLLFQVLFLLVTGIVASRVVGLKSISSLMFLATFPVTALLWLSSLSEGLKKTDWLMLSILGLTVFGVLIELLANLIAGNPGVGLSYFKKLIMFAMTLMFLQTCSKMRPPAILREQLHLLCSALVVLLTFMHLFFRGRMHMLNNIPTKYAPFNLPNPNMTALFFTCIFMLEVIRLLYVREQWKQIFHAVLGALMAYFIFDTRSRNGMLIMLLFTAAVVVIVNREWIFRKTGYRLPLRIGWVPAGLIACFPAVFAGLYMALINNRLIQKVFGFLNSEGKKLNSRVKVWKPAMEAIESSPVFGGYYRISDGTGVSQMHNTHLDIAASYGIPVMLLVCVLLTLYIRQGGKNHKSQISLLYMVGFCCALTLGIFEAAVFSGGMAVYVFAGVFLLLGTIHTPRRR